MSTLRMKRAGSWPIFSPSFTHCAIDELAPAIRPDLSDFWNLHGSLFNQTRDLIGF
jgi:hypothetical protein